MKNNTETIETERESRTFDLICQVRNAVQDALLMDSPEHWQDEQLEEIEEKVMADTRLVLDALTSRELWSRMALQTHISKAVTETRRLIHESCAAGLPAKKDVEPAA